MATKSKRLSLDFFRCCASIGLHTSLVDDPNTFFVFDVGLRCVSSLSYVSWQEALVDTKKVLGASMRTCVCSESAPWPGAGSSSSASRSTFLSFPSLLPRQQCAVVTQAQAHS